MTRESLFAARMEADTGTLMPLLPGGVYQAQELPMGGIARGATSPSNGAFDAAGKLEDCVLVRERDEIPDDTVRDGMVQMISTFQVVETLIYTAGTHASLEPVKQRMIELFEGWPIAGGFPVELVNIRADRDRGALRGTAFIKMDWQIISVRGE